MSGAHCTSEVRILLPIEISLFSQKTATYISDRLLNALKVWILNSILFLMPTVHEKVDSKTNRRAIYAAVLQCYHIRCVRMCKDIRIKIQGQSLLMSPPPPPPPPLTSSVSVPEWFELAGAKSNSRQKAGPHIDLPLVPTLSKSRVENCKLEKQALINIQS